VGMSLHGWSAVRRQLVLELRRQMLGFQLSPKKENRFFSPLVAFCASARERNFDSDFSPNDCCCTVAFQLIIPAFLGRRIRAQKRNAFLCPFI
jgi:hypothetical protein